MAEKKSGKLFLISAPSGAGKTTLVTTVLNRLQHKPVSVQRVVTYTTKSPRETERPGIDYHFVSATEFEDKIKQNFFIEYSTAYKNYYGSPRYILDQMSQEYMSFVLIIDRVGAQKIIEQQIPVVPIWIAPPSMNDLRDRLIGRATEDDAQIVSRLERAQAEIDLENEHTLYNYHITNRIFDQAACELESIFLQQLGLSTD